MVDIKFILRAVLVTSVAEVSKKRIKEWINNSNINEQSTLS